MKAQTVPDSRGLVPAIHVFITNAAKTWMLGTRPGMTTETTARSRISPRSPEKYDPA